MLFHYNRYRDPKPALYEPKTIIKEKATLGQSLGSVVNYHRISAPDKGTTKIAETSTLTFCKYHTIYFFSKINSKIFL